MQFVFISILTKSTTPGILNCWVGKLIVILYVCWSKHCCCCCCWLYRNELNLPALSMSPRFRARMREEVHIYYSIWLTQNLTLSLVAGWLAGWQPTHPSFMTSRRRRFSSSVLRRFLLLLLAGALPTTCPSTLLSLSIKLFGEARPHGPGSSFPPFCFMYMLVLGQPASSSAVHSGGGQWERKNANFSRRALIVKIIPFSPPDLFTTNYTVGTRMKYFWTDLGRGRHH